MGTNPTSEKAVALVYEPEKSGVPKVVASGKGEVAARILATAKSAGVHVVEDSELLEILGQIPVGQEIPEKLFQAVAEILAFVYRINNRYRDSE